MESRKLFQSIFLRQTCRFPLFFNRFIATAEAVPAGNEQEKKLFQYKVLEEGSHAARRIIINSKTRVQRYKNAQFVLEGKRVIQDALVAGIKPKMILFSKKETMEDLILPDYCYDIEKTVLYKVPYREIRIWSDLTTSPGIIGVFQMPNLAKKPTPIGALPLTIICDNIREPGNLGAVLRISAALPCSKLILTKGCVDIWESKVTRAGAGSYFQLPIINNVNWEDICEYEGNVVLADWCPLTSVQNTMKWKRKGNDYDDIFNIPVIPYFSIKYSQLSPLIVIVGGETEGLSPEAIKFAKERQGFRVNIPVSNYVDSLNTGASLGIICFEMKRQLAVSSLSTSAVATS